MPNALFTASEQNAPVSIHLPSMHPKQREIIQNTARFKVIVCGRRFGKTTLGVRECVKGALKTGGQHWWVTSTYKLAAPAWRELKRMCIDIPDVEIKETEKTVIIPRNGIPGTVMIKSADDPDSLRGEGLHAIVLDEFAQIKPYTWTEVLRPALADYKGWAIFIGTPKGKNWAYRLFESAKNRKDWAAFKIPTAITEDGTASTPVIGSNNPYIDFNELEDARGDLTPEEFAQEFLADFGVSQYLVFPEVSVETHEWQGKLPEFVAYYGGIDFGGDTIGAHKSAVALAGRTAHDELIIFAVFKQSGPNIAERQINWIYEQENRLKELCQALHQPYHQPIYRADKSQMMGIQLVHNSGLALYKTRGGPDSVEAGIEAMHRRLNKRTTQVTYPSGSREEQKPRLYWWHSGEGCHFVRDDLMAYRYPEPKDADEVQRKNPLKINDDLVDAIRYLVEGADLAVIGDPQELYSGMIPRIA